MINYKGICVTFIIFFYFIMKIIFCDKIIESELVLESGVGDNRVFTPEYLKLVKDFFLKA